jgi:hypothetical protein
MHNYCHCLYAGTKFRKEGRSPKARLVIHRNERAGGKIASITSHNHIETSRHPHVLYLL